MIIRQSHLGRLSGSERAQLVSNKLSLDTRLEVLTQQIVRARIYYDLWWLVTGSPSRELIIDQLNQFSDFFRFDNHAHFVSLIVHCTTVWDKNPNAISLPKLAGEILEPQRFSDHNATRLKISELEKGAAGLLKIRHNAVAHRNAVMDYAGVFEQANVIPDQIPTMLTEWLEVTNLLRQLKEMQPQCFRETPLCDFQKLILKLGGPDLRSSTALDDILRP
jgi:AbiU2